MVWAVSLLHVKLIPHVLTPEKYAGEFGVWLASQSGLHPLNYPVLYLSGLTLQASPKTISRRTSYHQVDWPFTPIPSSCKTFLTVDASSLFPLLKGIHSVQA